MDRERCIQRFARSAASTLLSLSGQLGTNPYIAVIVSVKCDGRIGRDPSSSLNLRTGMPTREQDAEPAIDGAGAVTEEDAGA